MYEPVEKENKVYLCALCVLYDSEWGRKARAPIEEVVRQVEAAREKEFESDGSNRLINSKDADDVLGVVVLSQRASAMRASELAR